MINICIKIIVVPVAVFLAGCATNQSSKLWTGPEFVLIESSNPAYCVLISFESMARLEGFELPIEQLKKMTIRGERFYQEPGKYLDKCTITNDYKGYNLKRDLPKVLEGLADTPVGLTWNSGIAFTYGDYRYTEKTYRWYIENPQADFDTRKGESGFDRIHPSHHLPFLLSSIEDQKQQNIEDMQRLEDECITTKRYLKELGADTQSLRQFERTNNKSIKNDFRKLNDKDVCEAIADNTFTDKKSLCLKWGSEKNRSGTYCLKWTEYRVGKGDFINELERRHGTLERCAFILYGDIPNCTASNQ